MRGRSWRVHRRRGPGGTRCAVAVTAFAEGITCRKQDDGLFFLAALYVGDAFVILTTDSTRVPLLAERAEER